jgi:hypothetical protein
MKVIIQLKSGYKREYPNAQIQKKNDGTSIAVYDVSTFRILAEHKADQIALCQSSTEQQKIQMAG